jgi:hypothetical protein
MTTTTRNTTPAVMAPHDSPRLGTLVEVVHVASGTVMARGRVTASQDASWYAVREADGCQSEWQVCGYELHAVK